MEEIATATVQAETKKVGRPAGSKSKVSFGVLGSSRGTFFAWGFFG